MELIENIATKQTEIHEMDWPSWCNRLQQTLSRAGNSEEVKAFIELKLNPLSPLWQAPFRPTFAENANSKMGLSYEKTLAEIEKSWEVAHLKVIGESP